MKQPDLFGRKPGRKPRRPGGYRRQEPPRTSRDTQWELPEGYRAGDLHPPTRETAETGATLPNSRHAGLACVPNEDQDPERPAEIVVLYVGEDVRCRG